MSVYVHDKTWTPERSYAQRISALEHANEIRRKRAKLKRDIGGGRATMVSVLMSPPDYAAAMKVIDLLLATPKIGRTKANKALVKARVSPSKTLGGMTLRQRLDLVEKLGARA